MRGRGADKVLLFIACLVAVVWGITELVQSLVPHHPAPQSVGQVMAIVAGALFTGAIISKSRNGGND